MIQSKTILKIADNSNIQLVRCLQVLNKGFRKNGSVGDIILASVISLKKSSSEKSKVSFRSYSRGDLVYAVTIQVKKKIIYGKLGKQGTGIHYNSNTFNQCVLIKGRGNRQVISTRLFCSVPFYFRYNSFGKLYSLSFRLFLIFALVAQLVEFLTSDQTVKGSSPFKCL